MCALFIVVSLNEVSPKYDVKIYVAWMYLVRMSALPDDRILLLHGRQDSFTFWYDADITDSSVNRAC